jgi:uncharacterized membrane protein HdeD (DUF308 family)
MVYKPTILNIAAVIIIVSCIVNTIVNYSQLSEGEGWGIVGMFGISGFGLALLLLDFIIQVIFRKRPK